VSGESSSTSEGRRTPATWDRESREWIKRLEAAHPRHDQTVAKLHGVLLRIAYHELSRRRGSLGAVSGPEFDDLAQQAADDALVNILAKVGEFRGLSRFTTWAYKFVMFEVSGKVARHTWRRQPPSAHELALEQLPDAFGGRPGEQAERREQLEALAASIGKLPQRQREVFVAIALNDVSIDVLAIELGSNRNAVYKNLFDARRNLRAALAARGYPVTDKDLSS
jgi:RNA polymerase sigma-70 factor (ECF subfamily)